MPDTPDPADVKQQLEAMAGHALDVAPEHVIVLRYPTGAHDLTDGTVAWRSLFLSGKYCNASPLLDASGAITTGANGSVTFLLSDVVCLPLVRSLAEPINLLASPHASSPCYVTTAHSVVAGNDVQMTVSSWDPAGNPAPGVAVHWRCRVVSNQIIG